MNTLDILMDGVKRFIDVLIVVNIFPIEKEILPKELLWDLFSHFKLNLPLHQVREVAGSNKT